MPSTIIKNEKGRYEFNFRYRRSRVHRTCPEGWTKKQAEAWIEKLKREIDAQLDGSAKPAVALTVAFARYEKEVVAFQKARQKTLNKVYSLLPYIEGKTVDQILECANRYLDDHRRTHAPGTINHHLQIFRNVAKLSYKPWGFLGHPLHFEITKLPVSNDRHNYLTKEQITMIYHAFDGVIEDIQARITEPDDGKNRKRKGSIEMVKISKKAMLVACYTGLRKSEFKLIGAENMIRDPAIPIESAKGPCITTVISFPPETKNDQPRIVPVLPIIEDHLDIFPLQIKVDFMYRMFKLAASRVGLGHFWFHDLRHTAASLLVNAGEDLYKVQRLLGHKDITTTQRYAHLNVDTLKKAMLKML